MEFLKKYWTIIFFIGGLISSATASQIQIAQNKQNISDNKSNADDSDAKIILLLQDKNKESKQLAEKQYAEAKKEIDKIKEKQEKQTVLQVNQKYIIEGLKDMQQSIKDLSKEIRDGRK